MALTITAWILRSTQLVFNVIIIALIGNMIALKPDGNGSPSSVNYNMFAVVFALLTWLYSVFAGLFFPDNLGAPMIILALDALAAIFYLCGGIALAAALGVHSCSSSGYLLSNGITNAVVNGTVVGLSQLCREGQAATAFIWFAFVAYTVSAVYIVVAGGLRGRGKISHV